MNENPRKLLREFLEDFINRQILPLLKNFNAMLSKNQFRKNDTKIRVCFLGYDDVWKRLHWIFLNEKYKMSSKKLEEAPNSFKIKVNKEVGRIDKSDKVIEIDKLYTLLKIFMREKLFIDPTTFLQSPSYYFDNDKLIKEFPKITKGIEVTTKNGSNQNLIGFLKDKKKVGLSMIAFQEAKIKYSPLAILDPRSFFPGYWDIIIGLESTLYIPIPDPNNKKERMGVLIISWDANEQDFLYKITLVEKDNQVVVSPLYESIAEEGERKEKDLERILNSFNDTSWQLKLIKTLFTAHLKIYHECVLNFDDYILDKILGKEKE